MLKSGDVFFPEIDNHWQEIKRENQNQIDHYDFTYKINNSK